jgi:hypothetical protein
MNLRVKTYSYCTTTAYRFIVLDYEPDSSKRRLASFSWWANNNCKSIRFSDNTVESSQVNGWCWRLQEDGVDSNACFIKNSLVLRQAYSQGIAGEHLFLRKSFIIILSLTQAIIYWRHSLYVMEQDAFLLLQVAATTMSCLDADESRQQSYVLLHSEQLTQFLNKYKSVISRIFRTGIRTVAKSTSIYGCD